MLIKSKDFSMKILIFNVMFIVEYKIIIKIDYILFDFIKFIVYVRNYGLNYLIVK